MPDAPSSQKSNPSGGTSVVEWITAGVSALFILAIAGFLLFKAVGPPDTPPLLEAKPVRVISVGDRYLLQIEVRNAGGTTAAGISLEGALRQDTTTVETAEITLDYVPSGGRVEAGLYFTHDPDRFRIALTPEGYRLP